MGLFKMKWNKRTVWSAGDGFSSVEITKDSSEKYSWVIMRYELDLGFGDIPPVCVARGYCRSLAEAKETSMEIYKNAA